MASHAKAPADKKRILVVEDDAELINLHRSYLSDFFTVDIESYGVDAIHYLKKNRDNIDLALIDLMLPDISGIDVLRELKKIIPFVPTIIVTAFGSEDVAVKAFRCGARDYIKKPFAYDELIKRVRFCLSLNVIEQPKHRTALIESETAVVEDKPHGQVPTKNYKIQRALHFIDNNYATDISLDQVAKKVSLSRFIFPASSRR
jgi:DNA-binding response OmpR family regulator